MKRTAIALAALVAASALATGSVAAEKTYTMKIGMPVINDSNHFSALWIEKELEKRSNGRIDVKVFPASQLGKIPRQIEGIQLGTQEAFSIPPGFFVGIDKGFMVTDAPGLFDDQAHANRAINQEPFREKFLNLGKDKGFTGGFLWACGDTSIATVKPFEKLSDMKGRKIRVLATPIERAVMEKMGATGVPMPYSEVLPGMQRGVIDGVRSAIIVMYPSKFWTVAKHITLTGMGVITCGNFISNIWLKSLPDDLRQMVFEVEKDATPHAAKWGIDLTAKAEKDWAKEAVVHRLSPEDQAELRKRVLPIGDEILADDPAAKEMWALLKEAVKATRKK